MSKKRIVYLMIFILFVAFLLFAPRGNILQTDVNNTFAPSSAEHLLGTDNIGRDVYSLILEGGVRTLEVVFLATAISFFLGTTLGMISAFSGKIFTSVPLGVCPW